MHKPLDLSYRVGRILHQKALEEGVKGQENDPGGRVVALYDLCRICDGGKRKFLFKKRCIQCKGEGFVKLPKPYDAK